MEIRAKSAEQAFHLILNNIKKEGIETSPRGLKIKEILNCCITIENPRDRIISCPERKINMAYAFGELCWYLSGRNDLEMMKYYSKFMEKGTDDGKTLNSAYGYRIFKGQHPLIPFNQWENVKRILREDSDSRQAIIHLHTPNNEKTNDEVCTLSLQFLIRDNKLNMITTMRSNDIFLGFTYDVFAFTMLQEILANELGVELGTYYHNVGSMHIYKNKFYILDKHTETNLSPMEPFKYCLEDFAGIIEIEEKYRTNVQELESKRISQMRKFELIESMKIGVYEHYRRNDILYNFAMSAFILKACKMLNIKMIQNEILNLMREKNENYADVLQYLGTFDKEGRKKIICGIDGAGKTTLANAIEKITNYQVQHYCKPSSYFNFYDNYLLNLESDINIIFDRFFISEILYGRLFKRKDRLSNNEVENLFNIAKKKNVEFIFIVATTEEELQVVYDRTKKEDESLKEYLKFLNDEYFNLAETLDERGFNVKIRSIQK